MKIDESVLSAAIERAVQEAERARLERIERHQKAIDRIKSESLGIREAVENRIRARAARYERARGYAIAREVFLWLAYDSWSWQVALPLLCGLLPLPPTVESRIREYSAWESKSKTLYMSDVGFEPQNEISLYRTLSGLDLWRDYSDIDHDWRSYRSKMIFNIREQVDLLDTLWSSGTHAPENPPTYYFQWVEKKSVLIDQAVHPLPEPWWKIPFIATVIEGAGDTLAPSLGVAPTPPMPRHQAQEAAILQWLRTQGIDPVALPKMVPGKGGGIKSRASEAMLDLKSVFSSALVFTKAWERLRASGEIADQDSPKLG